MTDLTTPKSASEIISDRIRADFVELIPPDEFKSMVQKEISRFFEDEIKSQGYNGSVVTDSPFKKMMKEAISLEFKGQLEAFMKSEDFATKYGTDGKLVISPFVEKFLEENMQLVVKAWLGSAIQMTTSSMLSQLRNSSGMIG